MGPEPGSACSVSGPNTICSTTISSTTAGQGCWKPPRSAGVICWARSEHDEEGSGSVRPSTNAPPVPQVPSLAETSTRPVGQAVQGRCFAKKQFQLDQVGWHTPGDGTVQNNDGKAMGLVAGGSSYGGVVIAGRDPSISWELGQPKGRLTAPRFRGSQCCRRLGWIKGWDARLRAPSKPWGERRAELSNA